jgi:hypothetical protein
MIETEEFNRRLGASSPLGPDDQIVLASGVRVHCTDAGWTAIFESLPADEPRMVALFEGCRRDPALIPFSTRSQHLALRLIASPDRNDTEWALQRLRESLQAMFPDQAVA